MRDYATISKRLRQYSENCVAYKLDADFANAVTDAADAIEELLAAVPKWISVEERLPKTADFVLTCSGEYVTENLLCTTIDVEGKHLVWAFCDGLVTHWMPLPEPPKEVRDA